MDLKACVKFEFIYLTPPSRKYWPDEGVGLLAPAGPQDRLRPGGGLRLLTIVWESRGLQRWRRGQGLHRGPRGHLLQRDHQGSQLRLQRRGH